ncbi:hypothetical protein P2318_02935 [Myxococcaceae bacterium GXIMD 01537]
MALKNGIWTLALGTLLFGSTAALADEHRWTGSEHEASANWGGGVQLGAEFGQGSFQVHVHSGNCNHGPMPRPPPRQHGRYEMQTVQRFVPGRYEQVWVPEQCDYRHRRRAVRCSGGYYEQQWVPGRYETVQEWVWVPAPRPRYGGGWSSPAGYWR